jgi:hypothetical protein
MHLQILIKLGLILNKIEAIIQSYTRGTMKKCRGEWKIAASSQPDI